MSLTNVYTIVRNTYGGGAYYSKGATYMVTEDAGTSFSQYAYVARGTGSGDTANDRYKVQESELDNYDTTSVDNGNNYSKVSVVARQPVISQPSDTLGVPLMEVSSGRLFYRLDCASSPPGKYTAIRFPGDRSYTTSKSVHPPANAADAFVNPNLQVGAGFYSARAAFQGSPHTGWVAMRSAQAVAAATYNNFSREKGNIYLAYIDAATNVNADLWYEFDNSVTGVWSGLEGTYGYYNDPYKKAYDFAEMKWCNKGLYAISSYGAGAPSTYANKLWLCVPPEGTAGYPVWTEISTGNTDSSITYIDVAASVDGDTIAILYYRADNAAVTTDPIGTMSTDGGVTWTDFTSSVGWMYLKKIILSNDGNTCVIMSKYNSTFTDTASVQVCRTFSSGEQTFETIMEKPDSNSNVGTSSKGYPADIALSEDMQTITLLSGNQTYSFGPHINSLGLALMQYTYNAGSDAWVKGGVIYTNTYVNDTSNIIDASLTRNRSSIAVDPPLTTSISASVQTALNAKMTVTTGVVDTADNVASDIANSFMDSGESYDGSVVYARMKTFLTSNVYGGRVQMSAAFYESFLSVSTNVEMTSDIQTRQNALSATKNVIYIETSTRNSPVEISADEVIIFTSDVAYADIDGVSLILVNLSGLDDYAALKTTLSSDIGIDNIIIGGVTSAISATSEADFFSAIDASYADMASAKTDEAFYIVLEDLGSSSDTIDLTAYTTYGIDLVTIVDTYILDTAKGFSDAVDIILMIGTGGIGHGSGGTAGGDPYITPLYGLQYKLPDREACYRLFERGNVFINGIVKAASEQKQQAILNYAHSIYANAGENLSVTEASKLLSLDNLLLGGYFFDAFLIYSEGKVLYIDLINKQFKTKSQEYFAIEQKATKSKGISNSNLYKNSKYTKVTVNWKHAEFGKMHSYVSFYNNPQIDNGISISKTMTTEDCVGLLMYNYKPKLMEIPKLTTLTHKKLHKRLKNAKKKFTNKRILLKSEEWSSISTNTVEHVTNKSIKKY